MSILNSNAINKIRDAVISELSPIQFPYGKNIFNKDEIQVDVALFLGGTASSGNFYVSGYIPVIEKAKIKLRSLVASTIVGSAFYDKNKVLIADSYMSNSDLIAVNGVRVVPEGSLYFRFCNSTVIENQKPSDMQVEYGEEFTVYEPFTSIPTTPNFRNPQEVFIKGKQAVEIDSIPNFENSQDVNIVADDKFRAISYPYGKNLFNKDTIKRDFAILNEGVLTAQTNWYTSNYIPVIEGAKIALREISSAETIYSAFYDKNKVLIDDSLISNSELAITKVRLVPKDAVYFRFSSLYTGLSWEIFIPINMQVEYGEISTEYESYNPFPTTPNFKEPQKVFFDDSPFKSLVYPYGKNLFNKDTRIDNVYINSNGEINEDAGNWYVSDFIPVIQRSKIKLREVISSEIIFSAFYDKSKKVIKSTILSNTNLIAQNNIRIVPPNAVYFRFTNRHSTLDWHHYTYQTMQVEYGEVFTEYEPYNYNHYLPNFRNPQEVFTKGSKPLSIQGYSEIVSNSKFDVLQYKRGNEVMAIHKNIAIKVDYKGYNGIILISENGVDGDYKHSVVYNSENFPNLNSDTVIRHILIIPFTRNMESVQTGADYRIVVVNHHGQIYHNFPARASDGDGTAEVGDITKFDESVIWDLEERKYPSPNPDASGVEKYTPGLPELAYKYSPAISQDNGYGNGGFGKSITHSGVTYPRFYEPNKNDSHSFKFMGGYVPTDKVTLLGTYVDNSTSGEASRICLFATTDGGRSWYVKYELAGNSGFTNYGVEIDTSDTRFDPNSKGSLSEYVSESFVLKDVKITYPTEAIKEPATLFNLGDDIIIESITKQKPAIITTKTPHGLINNAIVVIQNNSASSNVSPDWDWMKNDELTAISGGNGRLFKVELKSSTTFALREYVHSAYSNLPARHIHSINRTKDGFTMGTGESHPYGWLFYIPVHMTETYAPRRAYDALDVIRLTSSENAIQRPLGFLMLDDIDNTVIFASDEAFINRGTIALPEGRTATIKRNSQGVFKGKLADIDDISKFECIYEAVEVAYFFQEYLGIWIFGGQRGEGAISFDKGKSWVQWDKISPFGHFRGISKNIVVVGDVIITLKL